MSNHALSEYFINKTGRQYWEFLKQYSLSSLSLSDRKIIIHSSHTSHIVIVESLIRLCTYCARVHKQHILWYSPWMGIEWKAMTEWKIRISGQKKPNYIGYILFSGISASLDASGASGNFYWKFGLEKANLTCSTILGGAFQIPGAELCSWIEAGNFEYCIR